MSKLITEVCLSDFSGIEGAEPISITFGGLTYTADIHADDITEGQIKVSELLAVAKKSVTARDLRLERAKARRWAIQAGFSVSKSGRLPQHILNAYREAQC